MQGKLTAMKNMYETRNTRETTEGRVKSGVER